MDSSPVRARHWTNREVSAPSKAWRGSDGLAKGTVEIGLRQKSSRIGDIDLHPIAGAVNEGSGFITDERFRQAAMVAAENVSGVKRVRDHLYLFDAMSGSASARRKTTNGRRPARALPLGVSGSRDDPVHSAAAGVVLAVPSRAAAMASSTRSSQMNSSLLRAPKGMSS